MFGCKGDNLSADLQALCDDPKISSGGNYPPYIYVFRGYNYWKFDDKGKPGQPFGKLLAGNKPAREEFHGIHLPGGVSYNKNSFIIVYKQTWSQWKPLGKDLDDRKGMRVNDNEINNAPIGEVTIELVTEPPEGEDLPDDDPKDIGALIPTDESKGKYAKIRGEKVCYYKITDNSCTHTGKCKDVSEDSHNIPPNIVAVLKDRKKNWIFFNKKGKYCQRPDESTKDVSPVLSFCDSLLF